MGQKRRIYVPEITGAYATEDQILSRAREYFLIMVQMHTPKPLIALRDDVLPRYRAAFRIQEQRKSQSKIQELSCQALVDVMLASEVAGVRSLKEFQRARKASPSLYAASSALIDWSKQYNLSGKRAELDQTADPAVLKSARKDAVWPLVVGLETIVHWHFAPAGWLSERRNPPSWRPPIHLFKDAPLPSNTLPPIQLKSLVAWRPTTDEECAEVNAAQEKARQQVLEAYRISTSDCSAQVTKIADDFRSWMKRYPEVLEIDAPDWSIQVETEAQFRRRMHDGLNEWLQGHITERRNYARSLGLVEVPGPRNPEHFEWAAQYQVGGKSASVIVNEFRQHGYHISESGVEDAIQRVLDTIRLQRRPGKRGSKPKK